MTQTPAPPDHALLQALADAIPGVLCRGVPCQCSPGLGHNTPQYEAFAAEQRAHERYVDALESGLSDYEAREEGWPSRCDMNNDRHVTPHVGCILR